MTQTTQSFGFHIGESKDACSAQPMRLYFAPNAFTRVELRTVSRQQKYAQLSFITSNRLSNFAGFVDGMPIPNQKDGPRFHRPRLWGRSTIWRGSPLSRDDNEHEPVAAIQFHSGASFPPEKQFHLRQPQSMNPQVQ